jgi:hypothetical protein
MKRLTSLGLTLLVLAVLGGLAFTGRARTQSAPAPPGAVKEPAPTTPQLLMRDKLTYAKDALEGLSVADFDKVARAADMMRLISRASSWYVLDSEEYDRHSKDFQEQAADLGRHARARNLDAASLDYVRISLTCVQCHQYVRQARAAKKP